VNTVEGVDVSGGHVLAFAWLVALPIAVGLWNVRRSVLPALAVAPVLAVGVMVESARIGDTITRADVAALFTASIVGASCAVAPIAYVRWVRRVFDAAEHQLPSR
jgi:hypothetical protein